MLVGDAGIPRGNLAAARNATGGPILTGMQDPNALTQEATEGKAILITGSYHRRVQLSCSLFEDLGKEKTFLFCL